MAMKNKGREVSGCQSVRPKNVTGENRKEDKPAESMHCERGVERNQEEKERNH